MAVLVTIRVDDKGNAAIANLGKNAKQAKPSVESLGSTMKKAFAVLGVVQGLRLLGAELQKAAQEANAFELSMKRLSAIGKVTGDALTASRRGVRELATETEFGASKIGNAMLEVVKMGYDYAGAMEVMPDATDLATASMEDLSWASTNMINVMKAFGINSQESTKVANVMATSFNETSLNLKSYMESMTYVAPIASAMNISLEETTALLGVLSDMGLRGTIAGTTLKNAMLKLISPTDRVMEALEGVDFRGLSLTQTLGILNKQGVNTGDMLEQFDLRALAGSLAIGKRNDEVVKLTESLEKQETTAKGVAEGIREDYTMELAKAKNELNDTVIALNEIIAPYKIQMMQALGDSFKNFASYIENNEEEIEDLVSTLSNLVTNVLPNLIRYAKAFLGVWATLWTIKTLNNIRNQYSALGRMDGILDSIGGRAKGITTLKTSFGGLTTAISGAIGVGLTLKSLLEDIADAKMEAIDRQSKTHLEAMDDPAKMKKLSDALYEYVEARKMYNRELERRGIAEGRSIPFQDEIGKAMYENMMQSWSVLKDKYGYNKSQLKDLGFLENTAGSLVKRLRHEPEKTTSKNKSKDENDPYGLNIMPDSDSGSGSGSGKKSIDPRVEAADALLERIEMIQEQEKNRREFAKEKAEEEADEIIKLQELEWEAQEEIDRLKDELAEKEEFRTQRKLELAYASLDAFENIYSIFTNREDARHEQEMENLQEEMSLIDRKYERQISLAEGNLFKQQMLEQQHADEKLRIEEKLQAKKDEAAKAEKERALFLATLQSKLAILDIWAKEPSGFLGKSIAAIATAGIVAGLVGEIATANYRRGSEGLIDGQGNATSDSILARVSKGERVLSTDEIQRMGGNESIQRKIDLGESYSSGSPTTVVIENFIGNRRFARDFIRIAEKELSR